MIINDIYKAQIPKFIKFAEPLELYWQKTNGQL